MPRTRSTGTGGWVWVVFARDPARQRAAIEFIRDIESPAHAARISEATGHLPVRRSVYRDFPIFSQDHWYRRFGEMLVDGHARPTVPIYPEISQRLQLAIGSVVSGEKTPDEALDEAWRAVNDEYARQAVSRTSATRAASMRSPGCRSRSRSCFRSRCSGAGVGPPTPASSGGCSRRSRW